MKGPVDPEQPIDITELERRSGVARRTIHFYVSEGLLPAPEGRNRYARYTREHLLRLELIQILTDTTQLRLDGIREMLEPLTMDELEDYQRRLRSAPLETTSPYSTREIVKILERVEQTSAEEEEAPAGAPVSESGGPGEADMLRLSKRAMDVPADEADPYTAHSMRPGRIKRGGRPLDRPMLMRELLRESDDTDTWQRARITGDLEIHYRSTGNSAFLRNILRLISAARRIFQK